MIKQHESHQNKAPFLAPANLTPCLAEGKRSMAGTGSNIIGGTAEVASIAVLVEQSEGEDSAVLQVVGHKARFRRCGAAADVRWSIGRQLTALSRG